MGTIHVGWRKKDHFRCVTACEDLYTGIEKNLCFQPADLSVEKVSYEREPTAWFGHGFGLKKIIPGTGRSDGKRGEKS